MLQYGVELGCVETNVCRQVRRNTERPRNRYVTHKQFKSVYELAPEPVRCAMMLSYLTGLRQGDVLAPTKANITTDGLRVETSKTERVIVFEWTDELRGLIAQCHRLPTRLLTTHLIHNRTEQRYSGGGFRALW